MYDRHPIYEKFISLTAVQAGKEDRQFWKVTVSKKDYAPDFRSAEEKLLYLLSHFIEKIPAVWFRRNYRIRNFISVMF